MLRAMESSTFRVEKGPDGRFRWTFFEGQIAKLFGMTTDQVSGRLVDATASSMLDKQLPRRLDRALVGDTQRWTIEHEGRFYEFLVPLVRLPDQGVVHGAVSDVTESVEKEEATTRLTRELEEKSIRLEQARKHTDRLNYMLSHDLRNPLTVVLSLCEVARREIEQGRGDPVKRIDGIRRAGLRMNEMLTDILKLSRSQRVEPECAMVDLSTMAMDVFNQLASAHARKDVDFQAQDGLQVYADPNLLRDLLENLFSNALKYTSNEEHPWIRVTGEQRAGESWICVRDNGIGFQESEKKDLFEPFKRLPSAHMFAGTGVGLATVKQIVERHGGVIEASGAAGEGATFCFSLPEEEAGGERERDDMVAAMAGRNG